MTHPDTSAASPSRGGQSSRPWKRAALWLLFLGPFFFITYGAANWLTERRTGVHSVYYAWETRIPFIAWMIVPYMSIDFFYAVSLFICRDRAELARHGRRLLAASVISEAGNAWVSSARSIF